MSSKKSEIEQKWSSSELSGLNSTYLESLYTESKESGNGVDASMQSYFANMGKEDSEASLQNDAIKAQFIEMAKHPKIAASSQETVATDIHSSKTVGIMNLIYGYRSVGHQIADIDPLNHLIREKKDELDIAFHGLSQSDLNSEINLQDLTGHKPKALKEIIAALKKTYCGHVASEYMHLTNAEEKAWLRARLEGTQATPNLSADKKKWLLQRLTAAEGLEKYLGMRYVGQKRFSIEGAESMIPMLDELVQCSGEQGIKEVIVGMAHRGRLNVLVNIMGKSPEELFKEFEGSGEKAYLSGDAKYHMGYSSDVETEGGQVHLALAFNPSHLEIVAPAVNGSVRARQERRSDAKHETVLAVQIHGDAAFSGQGVVMETLNLSQTRGYHTGGTIHIICNNQIGFTTSHPADARSTFHCTDIAKMIEAPVFHVNGDDPEAVLFVTQLAVDYKVKFNKDVVIDLVCYRRHGHNEADEPSGTQPFMYQIIKKLPTTRALYAKQLQSGKTITTDDEKTLQKEFKALLEAGQAVAQKMIKDPKPMPFAVSWSDYLSQAWDQECKTSMPKKKLVEIAQALDVLPDDLVLQAQVKKTIQDRAKMTKGEIPVNWGYAEQLAYATLVAEGHPVRLSGEDCGRGTFAHRHAVLHNQNEQGVYIPVQHVKEGQGRFNVIDSILSEEAVMAFEYGYACSSPESLVLWEAQFGDFANTAQVMFDQFLSSGEAKWGRMCGLTLLLPHGQEGMGAEHSSARLERCMQLCAQENMQVCVPSTPAQIYHMLRRQIVRPYRKPLIVMTPKSLLRHPKVTSTFDELASGQFEVVIPEVEKLNDKSVKRVVICSGKIYYELVEMREKEGIKDIAIVRLEQLYPFPEQAMKSVMDQYKHVEDIVWCQEEPQNQGAWLVLQPYIQNILTNKQTLRYVGREAAAAPAVGYPSLHQAQQTELVKEALKG